jgi:hypothetical protein
MLNHSMRNILSLLNKRCKSHKNNSDLLFQNHLNSLTNLLILQGRSLALEISSRGPLDSLRDAEFKVFSQFGEDGIIQYLVQETQISEEEKIFIEFGVQDYTESNTRFLLQNNLWKGLIIDSSPYNINLVKTSQIYWRYDLTASTAWIDRHNINTIFSKHGFTGNIGILSIDIDGNDYWIWEAIDVVNPVIVIIEWNAIFGSRHPVTVPYDSGFDRQKAHFSCLYWGASISAFAALGVNKGYSLVGSNSAGNNLFFVRTDRLGRLAPLSASQAYVRPSFRDSRNESGLLDFKSFQQRYQVVENLPLVHTTTNQLTTLSALDTLVP